MTQSEYLAAAFKAYFPTSDITVDDQAEDESIFVHVATPTGEPDHFRLVSWSFTAGSDDDRYVFLHDPDGLDPDLYEPSDVITVPLMAEGV